VHGQLRSGADKFATIILGFVGLFIGIAVLCILLYVHSGELWAFELILTQSTFSFL
jgi:hypothetical protein